MVGRSLWSLGLPSLLLVAIGAAASIAACGGSGDTNTSTGGDDSGVGGDGTTGDGGSNAPDSSTYPCDGCANFPPIGTTPCAPSVLGPPNLVYPIDGILLPPNMNVLEVQFVPPAGATLFEVDFENAITDVRVETMCNAVPDVRGGASRGCGVTLPQAAWNDIANRNRDGDVVHVTVRATINGSCVTTSSQKIDIAFAKEDLAGGIYYWQAAVYGGVGGKTGRIYSHDFGTFDPTPTPFYTSGATGTCVDCHNVSRDGARMALATDDPDGDDEFADVKTHVMDVATRTVLGGAMMSPGFQTFTHDHGKMIASTYKTAQNGAFAVFDGDGAMLLATATLPGGMKATQPDLSRDDTKLVYVVPATGTISMRGDHHFTGGSLYGSTFDVATNAIGARLRASPRQQRIRQLLPAGVARVRHPAAAQQARRRLRELRAAADLDGGDRRRQDRALDTGDRSFVAFWLPFQDVKSHNHSAQWVEKVQAPPPVADGGMCVDIGGACNPGACCSYAVCCGNTCLSSCIR